MMMVLLMLKLMMVPMSVSAESDPQSARLGGETAHPSAS